MTEESASQTPPEYSRPKDENETSPPHDSNQIDPETQRYESALAFMFLGNNYIPYIPESSTDSDPAGPLTD